MTKGHDAKTQANRKSNQSNGLSGSERLGELQLNSTGLRTEPIRTDQTDRIWGNSDRDNQPQPENNLGKILERLDKLEKEFLLYVDAHQDRLGARLSESQSKKLAFLEEASSLRSDIYDLMSKEDCNNGNH